MRAFIITVIIILSLDSFSQDRPLSERVQYEKGQNSAASPANEKMMTSFGNSVIESRGFMISPKSNNEKVHKFGFSTFFQVDFLFTNFDEFEPLLGTANTSLMNRSNSIFNVGNALVYKKFYVSYNLGFVFNSDYSHDSLDIKFNTSQYGLHFGYHLIDSKRFLLNPEIAIKWNRHRLMNRNKGSQQNIADIRFNQLMGTGGLNLSYKMYKSSLLFSDYWTIGVYVGTVFKFNDKPWVYTKENSLDNDYKIMMKNYNIRFYITFNFE